jgi:hypothetical protein
MLHRFLSILMLLTLTACNGSNVSLPANHHMSTHKKIEIQPIAQQMTIEQYFGETVKQLIAKFRSEFSPFADQIIKYRNERIMICQKAVVVLKPEWNPSFCDPLLGNKKIECIDAIKTSVPQFIDQFCSLLVDETFRTNFDLLLAISVAKNESNFGVIRENTQDTDYVAMNTNFVTLKMKDVQEILNSKTILLKNGRTVHAKVLNSDLRHVNIDTGLAGEAGLFQLITPNYNAGRPIPGTSRTIPDGSVADRRLFMINDMEANIKIGIEELIRHRDIFPKNERTYFWYWIGCYNTGSMHRVGQWLYYSRRILKQYATMCENETIKNYFKKECDDLKLYQWYWEE